MQKGLCFEFVKLGFFHQFHLSFQFIKDQDMFLKWRGRYILQLSQYSLSQYGTPTILFLTLLVSSCSKTIVYHPFENEIQDKNESPIQSLADCNNPAQYLPDTIHPEYNHTYFVNINFHVVAYLDGRNNFSPEGMRPYFWLMTENANLRLRLNEKMKLPQGNEIPVYNPLYQYKIKPSFDIGNTTGQYHHLIEDKELAFFLNKGEGQNNYDTKIKSLAVHQDSILNIFIMSYPPDKMQRNAEIYHGAGIALGSVVKLAGIFQKGGPEWGYATLLNHEIGHVFGLAHAWTSDGCDDTPINANCFDDNQCKDGLSSNNLMDYNNSQMALTPCQIGRVRKVMSDEKSFQRKLLEPDWCLPKNDLTLSIHDTVIWRGARDLTGNIVVEAGGYLRLCCRVSMPKGSEIVVKPGGTLVLDNITLGNSCGFEWNGIVIGQKGKKKGKVVTIGKVLIENTTWRDDF